MGEPLVSAAFLVGGPTRRDSFNSFYSFKSKTQNLAAGRASYKTKPNPIAAGRASYRAQYFKPLPILWKGKSVGEPLVGGPSLWEGPLAAILLILLYPHPKPSPRVAPPTQT